MAYVSWPSTLPRTGLLNGYSYKLPDGRSINSVQIGIGRRRAFWSGKSSFHIVMNLTQAQFNRLIRFWNEDTNHGVDIFIMVDAARSGPILSNGQPLQIGATPIINTYKTLVQFGESPPDLTAVLAGDVYKTEFDIEVLP